MTSIRRFTPIILSLSALVISAPASAQLEEIIVTAQRRAESLQDVPISISAMTSEQFDLFDVTRADDLEAVFANVGTNRNAAGNTGISIRGVGTDTVHLSELRRRRAAIVCFFLRIEHKLYISEILDDSNCMEELSIFRGRTVNIRPTNKATRTVTRARQHRPASEIGLDDQPYILF